MSDSAGGAWGLVLGAGRGYLQHLLALCSPEFRQRLGKVVSGGLTPSRGVSVPLCSMWALGEGSKELVGGWVGFGWAPAETPGHLVWSWVSPPWRVSSSGTKVNCETTLDPSPPAFFPLLPRSPLFPSPVSPSPRGLQTKFKAQATWEILY